MPHANLSNGTLSSLLGTFNMAAVSMRYSHFAPRVYNLCRSLSFEPGKIMPSRAFCSDESQGYPIILLAKHFATFPFNHGLVGGIVATDRHGPHAQHGKDLFIIQASHVGYDPDSKQFGMYRRLQTSQQNATSNCGKICNALEWYLNEYEFAQNNIFLKYENGKHLVIIDNYLLHIEREQGLFLNLDFFINVDNRGLPPLPEASLSTAKVFIATKEFVNTLKGVDWRADSQQAIKQYLKPELFYFKRNISQHAEGRDHLEKNLLPVMPYIVNSESPALTAAQANTQIEFDRAYRSIAQDPAYKGKNVLFISGLNVDISPRKEQLFPLTKFIPWAAYIHDENGQQQIWEQNKLYEKLMQQSTENPDQISLEDEIEVMHDTKEIVLPF